MCVPTSQPATLWRANLSRRVCRERKQRRPVGLVQALLVRTRRRTVCPAKAVSQVVVALAPSWANLTDIEEEAVALW